MIVHQGERAYNMNKKILIVTPHYYSFTKGLIDAISSFFQEIYVMLYYDNIAELARYFPDFKFFNKIKKYSKSHIVESGKIPDNVNIILMKGKFGFIPRSSLGFARILIESLDREIVRRDIQFDLIHSHFIWPYGYAGMKLSARHSVPHIITAHGNDIYGLPYINNIWKQRIINILNSANYITTVSNSNFRIMKELGIIKQCAVIPNGFNDDLFSPRDATECRKLLGLDSNKSIIMSIGNLEPIKGHSDLILAIKKLISSTKGILCLIIGTGTLEKRLKHLVRINNLEDYIRFVGWIPHNQIPLWLNSCDIFVLPSLAEGCPTVLLEAMGCGKPIVATAVGGIPDIINPTVGYLCKPSSPDNLANALQKCLESSWNPNRIRQESMNFTWRNIAKKYLEIYSRIS